MKNFIGAVATAFSFFSIVPMPYMDFKRERMRLLPYALPVLGAAIGGLAFGFYKLLGLTELTPFFRGAALLLFFVIMTGGIHLDGYIDSSDGYFSRRETARKIEIMKDSRVGAFGLISVVCLLIAKLAALTELADKMPPALPWALLFVPVMSRTLMALQFFLYPYADDNVLSLMNLDGFKRVGSVPLIILFAAEATGLYLLAGPASLIMTGALLALYAVNYFSMKKNFGGITGDLMGGFLELAECFMFVVLSFI